MEGGFKHKIGITNLELLSVSLCSVFTVVNVQIFTLRMFQVMEEGVETIYACEFISKFCL